MKLNSLLLLLAVFITFTSVEAQNNREIQAKRVTDAPKIDGVLDDVSWTEAPIATDFIEFRPKKGSLAKDQTEVRLVYDNSAIYIGAKMLRNPDEKLLKELGSRDDLGVNASRIGVLLDTFDDDQNAFFFFLTSAGVQADIKVSNRDNEDSNWDAVWEGAVKDIEDGWVAEFKIPYSALRFPKTGIQQWGLNFFRMERTHRIESTWNGINIDEDGFVQQSGSLTNISDIDPPVRLELTPFISGNISKVTNSNADFGYNAGMDLKLGLTESFTLDMTLIPDFGDVRSDDQIHNLGPFEQRFNENRAFFTEGTELFGVNNVFYSRRIGQIGNGLGDPNDDLQTNEIVSSRPRSTKLLNATKVSGRTSNGWGLGFFNAFTKKAEATILDTLTNIARNYTVSPFTNYNILSVERTVGKNSKINVINTNVTRADKGRNANVTGLNLALRDKTNTWGINHRFNYSRVSEYDSAQSGYDGQGGFSNFLEVEKLSGKFQYGVWSSIEDDNYNPNDLGILFANNESNYGTYLSYQENEEGKLFNNWNVRTNIWRQAIFKPNQYVGYTANINAFVTWKNFMNTWLFLRTRPDGSKDFFEPRTGDFQTYVQWPENKLIDGGFSTDYRKKIALDMWGYHFEANGHFPFKEQGFGLSPRFRFSDKASLVGNYRRNSRPGQIGYVDNVNGTVVMGQRDRQNTSAALDFRYTFTPDMNFNIEGRYIWDKGEYERYFDLNSKGEFDANTTYGGEDDFNFTGFNIDANYRWRFAPGSDITVSYRNAITDLTNDVRSGFFSNLGEAFNADKSNLVTVKLLYYLDYNNARAWIKRKKNK